MVDVEFLHVAEGADGLLAGTLAAVLVSKLGASHRVDIPFQLTPAMEGASELRAVMEWGRDYARRYLQNVLSDDLGAGSQ